MSLLVADRTDAVADRSPARRPRTRAWVWALTLALAYLALPWAVTLDPAAEVGVPVDAGLSVPEYGPAGTVFLHYRHGEQVTLSVPVRNRGPVPVSVSGLRFDLPGYSLLEPAGTAGLPLELAPFETGSVEVTLTFAHCRYYHERAVQEVTSAQVTGTALGRGFTRPLRLETPVAVHGQVILDCPDRTLVRGDDVRLPDAG